MLKTMVKRFYRSYKGRWFVAIFAICFIMFILLVGDSFFLSRKFINERELNRINSMGMLLTLHIVEHVQTGDTAAIRKTLRRAMKEPDIEVVSVLTKKGVAIFSTDRAIEGRTDPFRDSPADALKSPVFYKTFLLDPEDSAKGSVQVGYSLRNISRHMNALVYHGLIIEVVMFFMILIIAWSITSALLKPLSVMKDVSNRIAAGDFSIRAPVMSHDIVGELAAALNNMAARLGDLTHNMHRKIDEATGALTQANAELTRKTLALEDSNRKLKELDTLKSDFVSMVSHELRTPLTSIIGFAKTMLTLDLAGDRRKQYLRIIESEGKRLAQLIEEYLDISRIEAGNFTLRTGPVDLGLLISEVADSFRINAGRRIICTISPDLPAVDGDRDRLKRVVINILDNALRYTPETGEVSVSAQDLGEDLVVSIKDGGPGIREEERGKLFEKFFRGTDDISERSRGSGLGLAIAKGIVEAHGGTIWATSSPGKGAVFSFSLPKTPGAYKGKEQYGKTYAAYR